MVVNWFSKGSFLLPIIIFLFLSLGCGGSSTGASSQDSRGGGSGESQSKEPVSTNQEASIDTSIAASFISSHYHNTIDYHLDIIESDIRTMLARLAAQGHSSTGRAVFEYKNILRESLLSYLNDFKSYILQVSNNHPTSLEDILYYLGEIRTIYHKQLQTDVSRIAGSDKDYLLNEFNMIEMIDFEIENFRLYFIALGFY